MVLIEVFGTGCVKCRRMTRNVEAAVRHADRGLVLDGCGDCCGKKKLRAVGIEPHMHIVATDCGIEKNGMADPRFDEIERLSSAVMEAIRG